jgi:hypothetical protein
MTFLTDQEKQVILEEAQNAKNIGYCHLTLSWESGVLARVNFDHNVEKEVLKARLDPTPKIRELLARGSKPLTARQTGV